MKMARYFLLPLLAGLSLQAQSAIIGFNPTDSAVSVGDIFDVELTVSGLGDDFVNGFDLDVTFDTSILGYNGFTFGSGLDVLGLGSLAFDTDLITLVNVFEVSLDLNTDLDFFQADDFVLGTFSFTALAEGTSALSASAPPGGFALSGANSADLVGADPSDPFIQFLWYELDTKLADGSVTVPEPGVALLLVTGLLGFGLQRRLRASA